MSQWSVNHALESIIAVQGEVSLWQEEVGWMLEREQLVSLKELKLLLQAAVGLAGIECFALVRLFQQEKSVSFVFVHYLETSTVMRWNIYALILSWQLTAINPPTAAAITASTSAAA